MKALLIIAHGSRRKAANDEIANVANQVSQLQSNGYDIVIHAFLEFAKPNIASGISQCVESGATEVTVVPYFLAAGSHVVRDIPTELSSCRKKHPELTINLSQHFGVMDSTAKNIVACAQM